MGRLSEFWGRRSKLGKAGIILGAFFLVGILAPKGDDKPAPTTTTQQAAAAVTTVRPTTTTRATTTTTTALTTTTAPTTTTSTAPPTTTTTESAAARRTAYLETTEALEFRKIEKRPADYLGKRIRFTGEVVQIMEDSTGTVVRLAVTKTDWGYDYDDIVWVWYPGPMDDVYDEDIIRVWGEGNGEQSYTSQAGWEITLPAMLVEYWEKVQ